MVLIQLTKFFNLLRNDKIVRSIACFILLLSVIIAIFFSSVSAIIILSSYISGIILCSFLLKYQKKAGHCLQRLASIYKGHFSPRRDSSEKICVICNGPGCSRHIHSNKKPWKHFHINKNLNTTLENFFDHIINHFVSSWYSKYTNDKSFVNELRHSLRFATASAARRILELDVGKVISNKLIPCAIKHIDDYLCMIQIAELKNTDLNKIAVEYLGKRLHVAASNRKNELQYLRHLSSALIERILQSENLKCRNFSVLLREILAVWVLLPLMDVLADPNIINSLVILITTYKPKSKGYMTENDGNETIEFLENFSKKEFTELALGSNLKTVLKNQQLLYAFMQYLKAEDCVHYLNFCLDVEGFHGKLLKPDLSKRQLEELHTEASNIYKSYLDQKSVDFIGCSTDISTQLNKLLEDGVYNVAKLQTSEPLFKAYDFVFNTLEMEWLPQFHHSAEFYKFICGSKVTTTYSKSAATSPFICPGSPVRVRQRKYYESGNQGAVSKISSGLGRIKGALQTKQPVEGSIYPHESKVMENDAAFVEDGNTSDSSSPYRDMSTWSIFIPAVATQQYGSKPIHIFNINVQRIDAIPENEIRHWVIERRDQDFYTLKAKLIEFHGESEICNSPLPSRKTTMSLDMRKAKYEEFLKKLLEKPSLKGSDLLHTFLTAEQDFTLLVTASMPIVDLENIYQSVAYKLRKEKGQHLDSFMNTYLQSTGRHKPSKFEWAEIGDEADHINMHQSNIYPKTMNNKVFVDNFGVQYKREQETSSSSINPSGITEAAFYLLKHIFKVPSSVLRLYVAICSVGQQAIESISKLYIERKIKAALNNPTLIFLIKELECVIFDHTVSPTAQELEERKNQAFKELDKAIPNLLVSLLGKDIKQGAKTILSILQNPLYNKQLAYNLVDIIISEMYPELDSAEEFY